MTDDNEVQEQSLRETLETAMAEHTSEPTPATETTEEAAPVEKTVAENRNEKGQFKAKADEPAVETVVATAKKAPLSWSKERQARFNSAPPEVQDAIIERESEVEKGFTKLDEDRNFGKSLKEVISPYMATIQAEGGTPAGAVKDLLNTAYVLRTGSPQQKAALATQMIKQFGIDPRLMGFQPGQQQAVNQPHIQPVNKEEIKQEIIKSLQTEQMNATIQTELQAFSADPKNVHFSNPAVKDYMSSLLGSGKAKNYQDAYDQALWLVPEIRPALIAAQTQPQQQQRSQEIAAKKKAGSSISGSPGITVPNSGNPNRSLREELEANMSAFAH